MDLLYILYWFLPFILTIEILERTEFLVELIENCYSKKIMWSRWVLQWSSHLKSSNHKVQTFFLVFDFGFVFSSFGHENKFFADYEKSNVRNKTICTIRQINDYGAI